MVLIYPRESWISLKLETLKKLGWSRAECKREPIKTS